MIYEEASTSPLVDSPRIREAYILILVTRHTDTRRQGCYEAVRRSERCLPHRAGVQALPLTGKCCQLVKMLLSLKGRFVDNYISFSPLVESFPFRLTSIFRRVSRLLVNRQNRILFNNGYF